MNKGSNHCRACAKEIEDEFELEDDYDLGRAECQTANILASSPAIPSLLIVLVVVVVVVLGHGSMLAKAFSAARRG